MNHDLGLFARNSASMVVGLKADKDAESLDLFGTRQCTALNASLRTALHGSNAKQCEKGELESHMIAANWIDSVLNLMDCDYLGAVATTREAQTWMTEKQLEWEFGPNSADFCRTQLNFVEPRSILSNPDEFRR